MGRPLRADTLERMALKATTSDGEVTLGKQVGYNKYIISETPRKIAVLATKLVEPYDATITLIHGEAEEKVLKITKNAFYTPTCVHGYKLDEDGKVVFLESDVSFAE